MGQTQTRKQKILGDVKKARRRRLVISTVIIAILAVGIVAGVIILSQQKPQDPHIGQPISTAIYDQLAGVSNTTLQKVGIGTGVTPLVQISGYPPLNSSGRSEFLYVGADYCPYCAAERWSMIVALSKFGTFTGIEYMMSSDTDVYPNSPTFTFVNAHYSSPYISFVSVEVRDRNNNPLQSLTSDQSNIVNTIDCPTLGSSQNCGGLAFIDINNKWIMGGAHAGAQFQPFGSQTCQYFCSQGNWTQIGSQLDTPGSAVAQAIDGAANTMITAICNVDGGLPNIVCSQTFAHVQAPMGATNAPIPDGLNMITTADIRTLDSSWRSLSGLTRYSLV